MPSLGGEVASGLAEESGKYHSNPLYLGKTQLAVLTENIFHIDTEPGSSFFRGHSPLYTPVRTEAQGGSTRTKVNAPSFESASA